MKLFEQIAKAMYGAYRLYIQESIGVNVPSWDSPVMYGKKAWIAAAQAAHKEIVAQTEALGLRYSVDLNQNEQYRMQMAAISTAAIGFHASDAPIHPDYDTTTLRDVARLYAEYDALRKELEALQCSPQADARDAELVAAVVYASTEAMNSSMESPSFDGSIILESHHAASLSLALDELEQHRAAIAAAKENK